MIRRLICLIRGHKYRLEYYSRAVGANGEWFWKTNCRRCGAVLLFGKGAEK